MYLIDLSISQKRPHLARGPLFLNLSRDPARRDWPGQRKRQRKKNPHN